MSCLTTPIAFCHYFQSFVVHLSLPALIADMWYSRSNEWLTCVGHSPLPYLWIFYSKIYFTVFLNFSVTFYPLFFFYLFLLTTDGLVWFSQPINDGCVANPLGFCSIYGILPYITASFGNLSSFDGSGYLFDSFSTFLQKTLSPLCFILL
jgi:hypothetical protein